MSPTAALFRTARRMLYDRFHDRLEVNPALNRSLVSYQSNRKRPFYRWFKYKEAFSAALVEHAIQYTGLRRGWLLDPFAGTGAALMVAREMGLNAFGVEIMPIGVRVIEAQLAAATVDIKQFAKQREAFSAGQWKVAIDEACAFRHLRITEGAFPPANERQLNQFRTYLAKTHLDPSVRTLLDLACLSVLESISYTRKDGQYLRWDHRAPRALTGRQFDKGPILPFDKAMNRQLSVMHTDLTAPGLFPKRPVASEQTVEITQGSCLAVLPVLPSGSFDLVVTSPPYCNRYDYTRTYALELAYLGVDEAGLKKLRQALLSCTVENKSKEAALRVEYTERGQADFFDRCRRAFEKQDALQEVLARLDHLGRNQRLNNTNVPRMVRNYFLESAVVVFELARLVKPGGYVVMVNDNVQYGGEEVPVDLILADFAETAGFEVARVWVLPRGKGNSSQQMGRHGRQELRKCVCVWRR